MDRWAGRVALVTGASEGIGRSIASRLVRHGMKVVACARNFERLQDLKESLKSEKGVVVPIQCDVKNETEILSMFDRIRKELGGVDVCINNAGVSIGSSILSGSTKEWKEIFEVNVFALCICSRESVKSMRERGIDDGFIINISSSAGHAPPMLSETGFYSASKHAVEALNKTLVTELRNAGSRIRVMDLSPGMVKTDILARVLPKEMIDKMYSTVETLTPEDIADLVEYGLSAPLRVQNLDVIIKPYFPAGFSPEKFRPPVNSK